MSVQTFKTDVTELMQTMPLTMTDDAIQYLRAQIKKQGHGAGLRIKIKTTGCSGKAYEPELIDNAQSHELSFKIADDLYLFVNPEDFLLYLKGLTIDYVKQGLNSGFKYINPKEKGGWGAGEGFTF